MLWQVKESTYQWVVGLLMALVVGLGGVSLGAYLERQEVDTIQEEVQVVAEALRVHRELPAHPVSDTRWREVLRFMNSIDKRLERLEERP